MNDHNRNLSTLLTGNYVLVTVSSGDWRPVKRDVKLGREAAASHGAKSSAVIASKRLMDGYDDELRAVQSAYGAVRSYTYANTLPWSRAGENEAKRGDRLLRADKTPFFLAEVTKLKKEANVRLKEFLDVYEQRRDAAMQNSLGTLADPSLYPSLDEIRARFYCRVEVNPVPLSTALGMTTMPTDLADALGERIAAQQNEALGNALSDLKARVVAELKRTAEVLGKHAAGEKISLYSSLVGNMRQAAQLVDDFNVDGSADMKDFAAQLRRLAEHDVKVIKASPSLAKKKVATAKELMNAIDQLEW